MIPTNHSLKLFKKKDSSLNSLNQLKPFSDLAISIKQNKSGLKESTVSTLFMKKCKTKYMNIYVIVLILHKLSILLVN